MDLKACKECTMKPLLLCFSMSVVFLLSACSTPAISTPTSTPKPTKVLPTKTPLPRLTPTQKTISLHACVTNSTTRIRRGPSTDFEVIGGMVSGTCMSILGRNQESDWVYVVSEDSKTGWVAASLLTIDGDLQQVSVQSSSEALSLAPATKIVPTQKLPATATPKPIIPPTSTPQPIVNLLPLCSDISDMLGERVSCRVQRAYCDYRPDVKGGPTFCDDRPYPNQDFQMVVFGQDWGDLDGKCLIVSGFLDTYKGVLQIQATSRSQVAYCK